MDLNDEFATTRVTRSLRRRLGSTDSISTTSSRPTTPASVLPTITETGKNDIYEHADTPTPSLRRTRRNSINISPSHAALQSPMHTKSVKKRAQTPDPVGTPGRRRTRANSLTMSDEEILKVANTGRTPMKKSNFPALVEEFVDNDDDEIEIEKQQSDNATTGSETKNAKKLKSIEKTTKIPKLIKDEAKNKISSVEKSSEVNEVSNQNQNLKVVKNLFHDEVINDNDDDDEGMKNVVNDVNENKERKESRQSTLFEMFNKNVEQTKTEKMGNQTIVAGSGDDETDFGNIDSSKKSLDDNLSSQAPRKLSSPVVKMRRTANNTNSFNKSAKSVGFDESKEEATKMIYPKTPGNLKKHKNPLLDDTNENDDESFKLIDVYNSDVGQQQTTENKVVEMIKTPGSTLENTPVNKKSLRSLEYRHSSTPYVHAINSSPSPSTSTTSLTLSKEIKQEPYDMDEEKFLRSGKSYSHSPPTTGGNRSNSRRESFVIEKSLTENEIKNHEDTPKKSVAGSETKTKSVSESELVLPLNVKDAIQTAKRLSATPRKLFPCSEIENEFETIECTPKRDLEAAAAANMTNEKHSSVLAKTPNKNSTKKTPKKQNSSKKSTSKLSLSQNLSVDLGEASNHDNDVDSSIKTKAIEMKSLPISIPNDKLANVDITSRRKSTTSSPAIENDTQSFNALSHNKSESSKKVASADDVAAIAAVTAAVSASSKKKNTPKKGAKDSLPKTNNGDDGDFGIFAKSSWQHCVSGKANSTTKIDTICAEESNEEQNISFNSNLTKEEKKAKSKSESKLRHSRYESDDDDDVEDAAMQSLRMLDDVDDEFDEALENEEEEKYEHPLIETETMEADENYESGDSMTAEERNELNENELLHDGESLGTSDTEEDEADDYGEEEEEDSFIATESENSVMINTHEYDEEEEEEETNCGENANDGYGDGETDATIENEDFGGGSMSGNQKEMKSVRKSYRRIRIMEEKKTSDDDDESANENESQSKQKKITGNGHAGAVQQPNDQEKQKLKSQRYRKTNFEDAVLNSTTSSNDEDDNDAEDDAANNADDDQSEPEKEESHHKSLTAKKLSSLGVGAAANGNNSKVEKKKTMTKNVDHDASFSSISSMSEDTRLEADVLAEQMTRKVLTARRSLKSSTNYYGNDKNAPETNNEKESDSDSEQNTQENESDGMEEASDVAMKNLVEKQQIDQGNSGSDEEKENLIVNQGEPMEIENDDDDGDGVVKESDNDEIEAKVGENESEDDGDEIAVNKNEKNLKNLQEFEKRTNKAGTTSKIIKARRTLHSNTINVDPPSVEENRYQYRRTLSGDINSYAKQHKTLSKSFTSEISERAADQHLTKEKEENDGQDVADVEDINDSIGADKREKKRNLKRLSKSVNDVEHETSWKQTIKKSKISNNLERDDSEEETLETVVEHSDSNDDSGEGANVMDVTMTNDKDPKKKTFHSSTPCLSANANYILKRCNEILGAAQREKNEQKAKDLAAKKQKQKEKRLRKILRKREKQLAADSTSSSSSCENSHVKAAVAKAVKGAIDILLNPLPEKKNKKKPNEQQELPAMIKSKLLPQELLNQIAETENKTKKTKNKIGGTTAGSNSALTEIGRHGKNQRVVKTTSGTFIETAITPPRKKEIRVFKTASGIMREESASPAINKSNSHGFHESPISRNPINVTTKVRRLLTAGQDIPPDYETSKTSVVGGKRKRFHIEESSSSSSHVLQKPWSTNSGVFIEEVIMDDVQPLPTKGSATEYSVSSLKSKRKRMKYEDYHSGAVAFKNEIVKRHVPREKTTELLRRKERAAAYKKF